MYTEPESSFLLLNNILIGSYVTPLSLVNYISHESHLWRLIVNTSLTLLTALTQRTESDPIIPPVSYPNTP